MTYADIVDNEVSDCGILDTVINPGNSGGTGGEGICEYLNYDASYGSNIAKFGQAYTGSKRGHLQQQIPFKTAVNLLFVGRKRA